MREVLEDDDVLGRFGGEEFVVTLTGSRARDAERIAESLRARVQRNLAAVDTRGIAVTVSIGVARLSDLGHLPEPTVDALLDAGDQAMYAAKAGGRNRVAVFSRDTRSKEDHIRGCDPATQ
jgi:diguanylate cyclase (GGDEF)-like protein